MQRREFLAYSGLGLAGLVLPHSRLIAAEQLLAPVDTAQRRRLAEVALAAARTAKASYCDVRIGRYLNQSVITREHQVGNVTNRESSGVGVRVLVNGAWGFAATHQQTEAAVHGAVEQATAIARANAGIQTRPVQLAPTPPVGEVRWQTPVRRNAMEVPIQDKIELLLALNSAALDAGADFINSTLFLVNEQKYFASSDGSFIDQDIHRIWLPFTATAIDKASGKFRTRAGLSSPMGMGYEFLDGDARGKVQLPGGITAYRDSYDPVEDAIAAARHAREKLKAPSVKPGKYDLVLDPSNLFLTIHENVGHPLELDRVLGYEANYAGTSFATLDKRDAGFRWGSDLVTFFADKTQPGSLGAVGYDDEGVKTQRWDLVRDGVLVDYQATRDEAHILGRDASHGCSYADSWSSVQFQRMANVSLAPGKAPLSVDDMIKDVENGIWIHGRGSYSIDQQRYNAQFGGQLYYQIKDGKIAGMVEDAAYQIRTPEFWNACTAICDQRDFRLGGSFFDGKGQPAQVSAVSHGSSTTRFNGINIINTARSLGA
ncbi:TldD/PmbA family protein [Stenotrophomonas sp. PFBMAA-4]|uniref:TldD/PmbA family protein n=1 Tax=Stenotrophomonas sp. PFBMAA-4 TaxID=3043301 RepID=UPI0024B4CFF7|nr:TldD/PmbA family protein [Stenotrophomonas sp. PFBMAA-4]MDI9274594.1 TldD/PmbA family protein [Stenotrophomonas sp. PFBMAA-4]